MKLLQCVAGLRATILNHRVHFLNGSSLLLSKVMVYGLYFVAIPPFISAHGQASYGIVAFFSTLIGYTVLLENGLSYAVTWRYTRAIAQGELLSNKIIKAAIPLYLLIFIVTLITVEIFAENISLSIWSKLDYVTAIRLLGVAVSILIIDALPASVLQSHNRLVTLNFNRFCADALRVAALYAAIFTTNPLDTVVLFFLASAILRFILDCSACLRGLESKDIFTPILSWTEIIANMRVAPTMFAIAMISLIISLYDKVVIAKLVLESDFAYYAFAGDICVKAYILFFAFSGTVYNTLIRRHATSGHVDDLINAYAMALIMMACGYYVPLSIFGHIVITHYLGENFSVHAMPLIRVLSVSSMLYLTFTAFEANLNSQGKIIPVLCSYIAGLALLLLSAPYLVKQYSTIGMGYALILMFAFMLLIVSVTYFTLRRSVKYKISIK